MPLNLYRRHRPDCEGGHAYDSRSGEFEERKKTGANAAVLFLPLERSPESSSASTQDIPIGTLHGQ
jgi:hypothetical protein